MPLPRVRFTVRRMMLAVAIVAVVIAAVWETVRPRPLRGQRYALIGLVDIDGDGRDDRAAVWRIIERAGGAVEFDLPPSGTARGAMRSNLSWYVLDERAWRTGRSAAEVAAIKEAWNMGARPTSARLLLRRLGMRNPTGSPTKVFSGATRP